ncbi:hypothetical protein TPE_2809 [Treponema pedis str. T A4]|uniref:Uncharacterized protein n=1 Tax=Treponema pedis str. T A4 TaxID=1291379 RepID=S6A5D6_9SPIR|nr:hypothetical protein TPE_2809 [Treponema pedis str. T A4]
MFLLLSYLFTFFLNNAILKVLNYFKIYCFEVVLKVLILK